MHVDWYEHRRVRECHLDRGTERPCCRLGVIKPDQDARNPAIAVAGGWDHGHGALSLVQQRRAHRTQDEA